MQRLIAVLATTAAIFHLWAAGVSPFTALVQRPVHLALMAAVGFLGVGLLEREREDRDSRAVGMAISWILTLATAAVCVYVATQHAELVQRSGSPTTSDLIAGAVAILVVLELARRATGWGLVTVAVLVLVYAFVGPWLPGILAHRGYGVRRLAEHLYLSTEGIWGVPLGVSADFVYLFILFGAVLDAAGGGALLIALADRVAGHTRGGPAKTAAVASAFMGAGAFILATWTSIPYVEVALAALVPAILYYGALLMAIHFRAWKMDLKPAQHATSEPGPAALAPVVPARRHRGAARHRQLAHARGVLGSGVGRRARARSS